MSLPQRRLVVEQPKEPLKFLIKEITSNPYPVPADAPKEEAPAAAAEAA